MPKGKPETSPELEALRDEPNTEMDSWVIAKIVESDPVRTSNRCSKHFNEMYPGWEHVFQLRRGKKTFYYYDPNKTRRRGDNRKRQPKSLATPKPNKVESDQVEVGYCMEKVLDGPEDWHYFKGESQELWIARKVK